MKASDAARVNSIIFSKKFTLKEVHSQPHTVLATADARDESFTSALNLLRMRYGSSFMPLFY